VAASTSGIVQVSLDVEGKNILYILVHSDGSVNRFGTPNRSLTGPDLSSNVEPTIGQTDRSLLQELLSAATPELIALHGHHRLDMNGVPCKLVVHVRVGERGADFEYHYGSAGAGPPPPIRTFVSRALELTDEWLLGIKNAGAR